MNKYIIFFFLLLGLGACKTPDQDVVPAKSAAAKIVRFRIYQNVNTFYDATIGDSTIVITIPIEVDRSTLRPEVLVSSGAIVSPKSGEIKNRRRHRCVVEGNRSGRAAVLSRTSTAGRTP